MTMRRTAAVFLLLTVFGSPMTTVACAWSCLPAAQATSPACQHHLATYSVKNADASCDRLTAASPYLTEENQRSLQAASPASAPPPFLIGALGEALLASVSDRDVALTHRTTSSLVLRL